MSFLGCSWSSDHHSLTIGRKKNIRFFPKRWRVRKNRSKVQVSPEVAALNARGPWGLFGAFWGISWMTLMTTKEKAAKEVLAQAQAPPPLGQQQATKVYKL